jgi:uncharacterized repeat protein (TIGR01451 family)
VYAYNTNGTSAHSSNITQGITQAFLVVTKTVDTKGEITAPLGGVVTYTIVIRNHGDEVANHAVMTDPLPSTVTFRDWVSYRGSVILPPPASVNLPPTMVTWQPGDLPPGRVLTLTFTVNVTNNAQEMGKTVTNIAYLNADNAPGVSDAASFIIEGEDFYYLYLPLIMRNFGVTLSTFRLIE